jgi:hypothetical protein
MMQNKNTFLVLGKDLLFIVLGCFLIVKGRFLGAVIGVLAIIWYGRDFLYRAKLFLGAKEPRRDTVERQSEPRRTEDTPIVDDGRIQVTDLSDAKEVDFEKE